jgi:hypothetical protein
LLFWPPTRAECNPSILIAAATWTSTTTQWAEPVQAGETVWNTKPSRYKW